MRKGDGVEVPERWANWYSRNVLGVPVWKLMWGRYIPRRKLAMTVFAWDEWGGETSTVWIMALRVTGVTGDSVGGVGWVFVGEEWEDGVSSSGATRGGGGGGGAGGGFAAWIALARAMVRLPWPVPASRISSGGDREDLSSG